MRTHFHFLLWAKKLKFNWHCLPCTFSTETLTQYPSEGKLQLTWKFYISLSLYLSKRSWQPPRWIQNHCHLRLLAQLKNLWPIHSILSSLLFSFNEMWEFSWLPRVCVISYWKGQTRWYELQKIRYIVWFRSNTGIENLISQIPFRYFENHIYILPPLFHLCAAE